MLRGSSEPIVSEQTERKNPPAISTRYYQLIRETGFPAGLLFVSARCAPRHVPSHLLIYNDLIQNKKGKFDIMIFVHWFDAET